MSVKTIKAGNIAMTVFSDGYPVAIHLEIEGYELIRLDHLQISDLEYVVGKAKLYAKSYVTDNHKHEA